METALAVHNVSGPIPSQYNVLQLLSVFKIRHAGEKKNIGCVF